MATASVEIIADSSQVRTATRDLQALAAQGRPVTAAATAATKNIGAIGKSAGQAGIQIQQFIGQIQGGQSAMVALAQQSADLGFVLGAPLLGALVSIGAAVGGMAFAAITGADDVGSLDEAVKKLGDAVVITDEGVALLAQEIENLAKVSEDAARAQLAQEIIDAKNVITVSIKEINNAFGTVSNSVALASSQFALYRQAVEDGAASQEGLSLSAIDASSPIFKLQQLVAQLNGKLGLTSEQSIKLVEALYDVRDTGSPEAVQRLQNVLSLLNRETGFTNKSLVKFASGMGEAFTAARDAGQIIQAAEGFIDDFDGALNNSTESAVELTDKTERLTKQLTIQNMELKGARLEAALYAAALSIGKDSADELDETVKQLVIDNFNLAESKRQVKEATKEQSEAQKELLRELKAEQDQILKARSTAGRFEGLQMDLAAEDNPAEQARQQLQARLDVVREYLQLENADREAALQAQLDAEQRYDEEILKLRRDGIEAIDWESFGNRAAGAFVAVASGAQSGTEAVRGLAIGIAQEAIGSLVKLGFTMATNTAAAQAGQATLTTSAVASGAAITAAMAPAAAAASVATAGAAPAAAAPIALSTIGAIIAALAGGAFIFGRQAGGQVLSGTPYLVGERGPELFTPNASGGGRITPFSQLMNEAGGQQNAPIINISNYGGQAEVQQSRWSETDKRFIIDIVAGDISQRGKTHGAITRNTTAGNRI